MIGNKLGPYEILRQLGAGGMGEVYLAQDTRLGRKVAVKVLPPQFATDPERLARFEQEARAAAALNHPHIAAVFDVGAETGADGTVTRFMVQEYLQGQSLRDRLAAGPLPQQESLTLGREIAEALAAAHAAGIVHRDLKPENVFLTKQGHAKVLDFGLAKLVEAGHMPAGSQTMSPTVIGTFAGVVMGTAGYMAPEQVQGLEVDRRTDVFAFGCVLWEMLTGTRAFAGRTLHQTLDLILSEPPGGDQPERADLPAPLRWVLDKCLAKQPARRYQDADDLVVDLQRLGEEAAAGHLSAPKPAPADTSPPAARPWLAWLLPAAVVIAAAAFLLTRDSGVRAPAPPARFLVGLPDTNSFRVSVGATIAVAPDGSAVVFRAQDASGIWHLWRRPLHAIDAEPIPGTAGAESVVFSPDSTSVAYVMGSELFVTEVEAGVARRLGDVGRNVRGIDWGPDGWIVVGHSDDAGVSHGLQRVDADGGVEGLIEPPGVAADSYRYPFFLPGGDEILFTIERVEQITTSEKELAIYSLSRDTLEVLPMRGAHARYFGGHLLFVRRGDLIALPFDIAGRRATGAEFVVATAVQSDADTGEAQFAISPAGMLAYSTNVDDTTSLAIIDRAGNVTPLPGQERRYSEPRLSPNGQRVVMTAYSADGNDLWMYELGSQAFTRYTFDGQSQRPAWLQQGAALLYTSYDDQGVYTLMRSPIDAAGQREAASFGDIRAADYYFDVHPDGETVLLMWNGNPWVAPPGEEPRVLVETPGVELWGTFSPDGHWVVHVSQERGRDMMYVTPYPSPGRHWQVAEGGGFEPRWGHDGREIVFRRGTSFMSVPFDPQREPPVGEPVELFTNDRVLTFMDTPQYVVDHEGNFIALMLAQAGGARTVLITSLAQELERLKGAGR